MTDNNHILTERFIKEASQAQIADNGFSNRVMSHLPTNSARMERMWTLFCIVLSAVLFFTLDLWSNASENIEALLHKSYLIEISATSILNTLLIFIAIVSAAAYAAIHKERLAI